MKLLKGLIIIVTTLGCVGLTAMEEPEGYVDVIETTDPNINVTVAVTRKNIWEARVDDQDPVKGVTISKQKPGRLELEESLLITPAYMTEVTVVDNINDTVWRDVGRAIQESDPENESGRWKLVIGKDDISWAKAEKTPEELAAEKAALEAFEERQTEAMEEWHKKQ